jgi:hypothetical protein
MRIDLRIDRLVLDGVGVAPDRADAVRRAVEAELSRLLTTAPAADRPHSRRQRRADGPPGAQIGANLGTGIARSVYGAVTRAD